VKFHGGVQLGFQMIEGKVSGDAQKSLKQAQKTGSLAGQTAIAPAGRARQDSHGVPALGWS
jgi:hypothetical protein